MDESHLLSTMTRDQIVAAIRETARTTSPADRAWREVLQRRLRELDALAKAAAQWDADVASAEDPKDATTKLDPGRAPDPKPPDTGRSVYVPVRVPRWLMEKVGDWCVAQGQTRSQAVVAGLKLLIGEERK